MEKMKFFRTIVTVEVLSEDFPVEFDDLKDLDYLITEGHCSGMVQVMSSELVSGLEMAQLLIKQRSDPEFFRLDIDGNFLDELT